MQRTSLPLLALLALATAAAASETTAYSRVFGPKANMMMAKPTLRWEVWPGEGGKITSKTMLLNGRSVEVKYDPSERALLYTPDRPLAAGQYKVECRVVINDSLVANKSWAFTVASTAATNLPSPNETQMRALDEANDVRKMLGLSPFELDSRMSTASLEHSRYLSRHNTTGHYQKAGTTGFFGNDPSERLEAYGYVDDSWECVDYGHETPEEAVWSLFDAPYHRIPFLQPGSLLVGTGFADRRLTMEFSGTRQSGTVVSPAPNQTGVPTKWSGNERPDPLRLHTGARLPVGYVVVFSHWMPGGCEIDVKDAWLKNTSDGSTVDVWLNTPDNDDRLDNVAFMIPTKPLKPNTRYEAFIRVSSDPDSAKLPIEQIERKWQFTTGAKGR